MNKFLLAGKVISPVTENEFDRSFILMTNDVVPVGGKPMDVQQFHEINTHINISSLKVGDIVTVVSKVLRENQDDAPRIHATEVNRIVGSL